MLPRIFDHLNPNSRYTRIYVMLSTLRPFALGFCHAYLNYYGGLQLCSLLIVELLALLLVAWTYKCFTSKTVRVSIFIKQLMRVLLQSTMIAECYMGDSEFNSKIFATP